MKNNNPQTTAAQTDWFLTGCGAFVFLVTLIWAVCFVPMNMDEAGIFHPLACWDYPYSIYQLFRESCTNINDITLPLGMQISHAEYYTGFWHSFLYAPFYFLIHAYWGQYVFGLVYFGAFAWLLSRETKKPFLALAIYLSFFPFLFQFIHDMGPVKFALLMFPLGALLYRKATESDAPVSYAYAALLAFLCLAGTEEKPFFLYTLPSLSLFILAMTVEKGDGIAQLRRRLHAQWKPLAVLAGLGALGLLVLFFSTIRATNFYGFWLFRLSQATLPIDMWAEYFFDFMLYWPSYAHNYHDIWSGFGNAIGFRVATVVVAGFTAAMALQGGFTRSYPRLKLYLLLASSAATFFVFLLLRNEWAGHHFVFLWVPLMVLFVDLVMSLRPAVAMIVVTGFLALNMWSMLTMTQTNEKVLSSRERLAIFDYFSDPTIAAQSLVNYSSWGGYYIQSLYGPKNQLVTYSEPYAAERIRTATLAPSDAGALLVLAQKTGRRLYNVCQGELCNGMRLQSVFPKGVTVEEVIPGLPNWHVFAVNQTGNK